MNLAKWVEMGALVVIAGVAGYQLGVRNAAVSEPSESITQSSSDTEYQEYVVARSLQTTESSSNEPSPPSLRDIFDSKDDQSRWRLASQYFDRLTSDNIEQYLADIEELPPSARKGDMYTALFHKWAEIDGSAAFAHAMEMKGQKRSAYLSTVASSWAKTNPIEAWEALMTATNNGRMASSWAGGVITAIADKDLKMAFDLTSEYSTGGKISFGTGGEAMEDSEQSRSAMTGFLNGWAAADGNEAFQYAIENQSVEAVADALPGIAISLVRGATDDEFDAILYQLDSIVDKDALSNSRFMSTLARVNPEAGMQFANQVSDPKKREQSVRTVAMNWARADLAAADEYVRSIEDDDTRKTATSSILYAHINEQTDPLEILALTEGYSDPKLTGNILSNIVSNAVNERNKPKTGALVEKLKETLPNRTDIPEETKQRLIERLNK